MKPFFLFLYLLLSGFFTPSSPVKLDAEQFLRIQTQKSGWANLHRAANFYIRSERYSPLNKTRVTSSRTEIYKLPYQSYQVDSTQYGQSISINNIREVYQKSLSGKEIRFMDSRGFLRLPMFAPEMRLLNILEEEPRAGIILSEENFQSKPVYKITMEHDYQVFPLYYYYDKQTFNLIAVQNGYNYTFYEGWRMIDGFNVPTQITYKNGFVIMGKETITEFTINKPLNYNLYFTKTN